MVQQGLLQGLVGDHHHSDEIHFAFDNRNIIHKITVFVLFFDIQGNELLCELNIMKTLSRLLPRMNFYDFLVVLL